MTEEEPKVQTRHSPGSPKKKRSDTVSSANSRSSFSPPSISTVRRKVGLISEKSINFFKAIFLKISIQCMYKKKFPIKFAT